jgi:glycosyltransferase involved in cell wall biosynthesis
MRIFRSDLRLLPNPINVQRYPYRLRTSPEPKLAWLRAFHSIYHPWLAPAVIAHLRPAFPNIRLAMAGPDKGDGSLQKTRQHAAETRTLEQIEFVGSLDKSAVPQWLSQHDVFINTTRVDNTPVSLLEAMACGLPVVTTNVGGLPYLLRDQQEALLVPPDDAGAMADAIRRVLSEPRLATRLSTQGRRLVEGFDWSVLLPQWESLLQEVLRTRETPKPRTAAASPMEVANAN